MAKTKVSINDIASKLNVSKTTVSFILNGKAKEKRIRERGRWRGQEFEGREEHQQKVREANIRRQYRKKEE